MLTSGTILHYYCIATGLIDVFVVMATNNDVYPSYSFGKLAVQFDPGVGEANYEATSLLSIIKLAETTSKEAKLRAFL